MENQNHKKESPYSIPIAIVIAGVILGGSLFYTSKINSPKQIASEKNTSQKVEVSALEESVLPSDGVVLPITWNDLGVQLVQSGTIDSDKFQAIYQSRGGLTEGNKKLLLGKENGRLKITKENSGYILNLLWALGLANSNPILTSGEMSNPKYGGAENFASTGGWTIARGNPMDHYSRHAFIQLTVDEQTLVDRVSRGIFRPCCGNSTHFPDCNHGMAMLGLLEIMASQGVGEKDMYKTALIVNSYWFPDTYMTIAQYMKDKNIEWQDVNPQEMLGVNYSSGQGFARIASQATIPTSSQGGSGCGVDTEAPVSAPAPTRQQTGCGI